MKWATCKLIPVLAVLAAGPALADRSVDETRPAEPGARIQFSAVTGEYEIIGSEAARLEITGTLGEDVEELIIEGGPSDWRIEVKPKEQRGRNFGFRSGSRLVISLPRGADLEVRTVSAGAELLDLDGPRVSAKSVSGRVGLSNVRPQRLIVETVSGEQSLDAGGRVESRLKSVSGNIRASGLSGRAEINSVSGNLDLQASQVDEARLESVSGRIEARIEPAERASLRLSSHSGDVRLALPAGTPMDFRASTFSGRIDNAFGGDLERRRGPGERMEVLAGDGSVRVEAQSFSGRIHLERLD